MKMSGIGASAGIGIGRVVALRNPQLDYSGVAFAGTERETQRLHEAVAEFTRRTQTMADTLRRDAGEKEAEILLGQISMISDPYMVSQMEEAIAGGACAEGAVDSVCTMYAQLFSGMEDELMRQRATDVRDLRARLLAQLLGVEQADLAALPQGSVLAAHDLTPSMTVGLDANRVAGILTEVGGVTSHSAILARALSLPAVLSVPGLLDQVHDGDEVILDGADGSVFLHPDAATRETYLRRREEQRAQRARLEPYRTLPTRDADGNAYALYANIGSPAEAKSALEGGAEVVGLFRTEFLFMDRDSAPTEEEQFQAYRAVSQTMAGKEVIIRTLDVGGDKAISYLGMEREDNPFLGHRAIRYCLSHPELFRVQLRALLRAGAEGRNLKIMLPMVTCLDELRAARDLLEQCKAELNAENTPYDADISLGIMVETPAAVMLADVLAREADFFSIGTNDLTQYTMAADRGNAQVKALYSAFQPAVLRGIRTVIAAGKAAGIPVGMCGEAAADPRLIPLLLAWGLDEFSVSASAILEARRTIAQWGAADARAAESAAMALDTAGAVQDALQARIK